MKTRGIWIGVGALAAALAWGGCKRQEEQGTGGGGISEQIGKAQEQSKQAFEKAQGAVEKAQSEQQKAEIGPAGGREETPGARASRAEGESGAAEGAAGPTTGAAAGAAGPADRPDVSAAGAAGPAAGRTTVAAGAREVRAAEPAGGAAVGGGGAAGQEKQVSGELQQASKDSIVVKTDQQGPITLCLDPNTTVVMIDGQKSSVDQLQKGSDIRASYSMQNNRPTAKQIQASARSSRCSNSSNNPPACAHPGEARRVVQRRASSRGRAQFPSAPRTLLAGSGR